MWSGRQAQAQAPRARGDVLKGEKKKKRSLWTKAGCLPSGRHFFFSFFFSPKSGDGKPEAVWESIRGTEIKWEKILKN